MIILVFPALVLACLFFDLKLLKRQLAGESVKGYYFIPYYTIILIIFPLSIVFFIATGGPLGMIEPFIPEDISKLLHWVTYPLISLAILITFLVGLLDRARHITTSKLILKCHYVAYGFVCYNLLFPMSLAVVGGV